MTVADLLTTLAKLPPEWEIVVCGYNVEADEIHVVDPAMYPGEVALRHCRSEKVVVIG